MNICIVTFGPEYNSSMNLHHNAELGADRFEQAFVKFLNKGSHNITTKKIRGIKCNASNICNMLENIEQIYHKIIIYYTGHGDHTLSKEFWKTPCGNVDQIRVANLINQMKATVIIFSDCCSSEHNVNEKAIHHPYISFGATMDYQDAIMQYGGGVFTQTIIDLLEICDINITSFDFFEELIKCNIDVETFSVRYSSLELFNSKLI